MKQVLIKQGGVTVENIPAPKIEPQIVLVRVKKSCVSIGTEMSSLPLWQQNQATQIANQVELLLGK